MKFTYLMVSIVLVLSGLLFIVLGYANYSRPAAMFKIYYWPLSTGQETGDGVDTTFRRRGYLLTAFGVVIVLWGLAAK